MKLSTSLMFQFRRTQLSFPDQARQAIIWSTPKKHPHTSQDHATPTFLVQSQQPHQALTLLSLQQRVIAPTAHEENLARKRWDGAVVAYLLKTCLHDSGGLVASPVVLLNEPSRRDVFWTSTFAGGHFLGLFPGDEHEVLPVFDLRHFLGYLLRAGCLAVSFTSMIMPFSAVFWRKDILDDGKTVAHVVD